MANGPHKNRNLVVAAAAFGVLAVLLGIALVGNVVGGPTDDLEDPGVGPRDEPSIVPRDGASGDASTGASGGAIQCTEPPPAPGSAPSFDEVPDAGLAEGATWRATIATNCGDPTGSGTGGPGYGYQIENAPEDGTYPRGTLAMARTMDPDSNGSQFFIVYDQTRLPVEGGGYSVFGQVVEGMEIVDAIAARGVAEQAPDGPPAQPISILDVTVERA